MISACAACGAILARYAPFDGEVQLELCPTCTARQLEVERIALTCGAPACAYPEIPYQCLRDAAANRPHGCPAQSA